jgi:hypothetical protein
MSVVRLQCSACGAEANASCNCGKPYVPAAQRVREYDEANPGKSTRAAAADLGMSRESVRTARSGDNHLSPETVTGRDGKEYPARRRAGDAALESSDNSESDGGSEAEDQESAVAEPAVIEDNVLYYLQRMNEHARVYKKLFKASTFDREAEERISTAIDRTIQKLRSAQATLTKRNRNPSTVT